jgi:hypothetical protein
MTQGHCASAVFFTSAFLITLIFISTLLDTAVNGIGTARQLAQVLDRYVHQPGAQRRFREGLRLVHCLFSWMNPQFTSSARRLAAASRAMDTTPASKLFL